MPIAIPQSSFRTLERDSIEVPEILRFGSWVGGDMDGNPDVHAKTIRETLHRHQRVIISTYYQECLDLADKLSQSASRVRVSRALEQRIADYSLILPAARAATQVASTHRARRTVAPHAITKLASSGRHHTQRVRDNGGGAVCVWPTTTTTV